MTPPRTLDELLAELCQSYPEALLDPDQVIRSHYWANSFRVDFLERRRMHARVAALRFLVLTQMFDEGESLRGLYGAKIDTTYIDTIPVRVALLFQSITITRAGSLRCRSRRGRS